MIAHIRTSNRQTQPLQVHCRTVSRLCSFFAEAIGVPHLAALIGLLHDMGKATQAFMAYLYATLTDDHAASPHYHALTGAMYAYHRWFLTAGTSMYRRLTAQLVTLCVHGHHAGLADCWDYMGDSPLIRSLRENEDAVHAEEAITWFLQNVADGAELDDLFDKSCQEIATLFPDFSEDSPRQASMAGLLGRLLLSMLADADRWDTACFAYGEDPLVMPERADWQSLLHTFERYRAEHLDGEGTINRIRANISDICYEKAASAPGIYTLSVPTGGGKTYASLRYALRHAQVNGQSRIFYIIPYNTILDQNARDIRTALNDYPSILEHHANVVIETEEEQTVYQRLTERWDSDMILTSLVQFLNACYAAPNTAARRMHRLTNAVLIFDEIQSLPRQCKVLFERAIRFLNVYGHSTVILCTATQPKLSSALSAVELMPNVDALYTQLKRVHFVSQLDRNRTCASAGKDIAQILKDKSVLAILNTKAAAWQVYRETMKTLKSQGAVFVAFDKSVSEKDIPRIAENCPDDHILCIHMSTQLCPAHRIKLIAWMKAFLKAGKRVLCVSTALIEAGINVSFPVVIRDLASLPSIIQAAGRANRNMEYDNGLVLIWDFPEETNALAYLPDIQNGGNITRSFLNNASICPEELDTPARMAAYFAREEAYIKDKQKFCVQVREGSKTETRCLTKWLALNRDYEAMAQHNKWSSQLVLHQSFRTAAQHFYVIEEDTIPVLVPWGEGKRIIAALGEKHEMRAEVLLLRKAQAYTVNLYAQTYQRLMEQNAIVPLGACGAFALAEGWYSDEAGVRIEKILFS